MNSVTDIWENVLRQLRETLSETTIATWFDELRIVDIKGGTCYLHCASDFKRGYLESLFLNNIKASLRDIFSMDFEVKILDDAGLLEFQGGPAPRKQQERFTYAEFTFQNFVVGPSNKLAHAASIAVAEHPAQNYNPLLIYGDSGLGKTHLLYAIANVIRQNDPAAKIVYIKGDEFINEFIELVRSGQIPGGGPASGGRRAVRGGEGAGPERVFPHLQHPLRVRAADRADLRPPPL